MAVVRGGNRLTAVAGETCPGLCNVMGYKEGACLQREETYVNVTPTVMRYHNVIGYHTAVP